MIPPVGPRDVIGLLRPGLDAHSLGLTSVAQLLAECELRAVVADARICEAVGEPERPGAMSALERWIREEQITRLGFSYRLDPEDGVELFQRLVRQLQRRRLTAEFGGPLISLYFAGLPDACRLVTSRFGDSVHTFCGDEPPGETLGKLGVPTVARPSALSHEIAYDETRLSFARDLLEQGKHLTVRPVDRSGYDGFGTGRDRVVSRLQHGAEHGLPPLMRAHVGPYLPDRAQAVHLFLEWTRRLAESGLLDILSIGTSQLSQSHFGEEWEDAPNGGGVPINSPEELRATWDAARPMLVRIYAGTRNVPWLARLYEDTVNIAWHALSLWWFCQIDGRGPHTVQQNLAQHVETLRFVAGSGKPYEPNVPHHFAFRGADDVTYVVSGLLAARTAKALGVRHLVLQNMLNTPKATWGVQDLAKSRAMLTLARELEEESFRIILQPRAGLDYFSPDPERARIQLAAVTALMDDIEPHESYSPPIIHVVSYSEGSRLADPEVIEESIQLTRAALDEYRQLRRRGEVDDMARHPEVVRRTTELLSGARAVLALIEAAIFSPYTAEGLYEVMRAGFLPVPYLWECREEFSRAVQWRTKVINGGVAVVDEQGAPVPPEARARVAAEAVRGSALVRENH